jgi:hypothetical protein
MRQFPFSIDEVTVNYFSCLNDIIVSQSCQVKTICPCFDSGNQLARHSDGSGHTESICTTLSSDVKSRAVIGAGSHQWQTKGDIDALL